MHAGFGLALVEFCNRKKFYLEPERFAEIDVKRANRRDAFGENIFQLDWDSEREIY